ncbi:MAG: DNA internalization-related competence protein ComEC/Rec2 [Proteobacteria bacterium]|nr:DNA internalization-related competence protein ComEC/Rec2 [Pseudomonadota bacterium]
MPVPHDTPYPLTPLVVAFAFAVGIAVAPLLDALGVVPTARWAACATVLVMIGVVGRRVRDRRLDLALGLGALAFAGAARGALPASAPVGIDDRELDRIEGVVDGAVVETPTGMGALVGEVWVWADQALVPGEAIAVTGLLRSARGSRGDEQPDRERTLAARGATAELTAVTIERLADDPGVRDRVWRWAARARATGAATIEEAGGDPVGRAALRGITLGDRRDIPPALDARWRALGIYHVLSVSGLHLAVIAGLAFATLRRIAAALARRASAARLAGPPAIAIAVAYTLVTGAQLATLRALVAIAIVIVGAMLERPVRLLDAIGVAALGLLLWHPLDLFDPGFQLSFVAALVLALRARREPVDALAEPPTSVRRIVAWLGRGIATSAWVALATAPITALQFQEVAIGGLVGNVVFAPILELVALPLALGGVVLGLALPIRLASDVVGWIDRGVGVLAEGAPIGKVAIASPLVAAILVGLALALARTPRHRHALVLATCLGWLVARAPPPIGDLRVTFVDVGQGDAAIVELPDGAVWLVDAGGEAAAREVAAQAAPGRAITRILRARGHDHVDLVVISHPHPDHYLGLLGLDLPVHAVWSAREPPAGPSAFSEVVRAIGQVATPPTLGVHTSGDVELAVLAPRFDDAHAPALATTDPVRTVNDNSLVVAIRYRGRAILFAGDLEAEGEAALAPGRVDVVKVPHHGSRTSSSAAFVAATHPTLAIISCGRGNRFGFPAPEVVARWRAAGATVLRTDLLGAITLTIDADGALYWLPNP